MNSLNMNLYRRIDYQFTDRKRLTARTVVGPRSADNSRIKQLVPPRRLEGMDVDANFGHLVHNHFECGVPHEFRQYVEVARVSEGTPKAPRIAHDTHIPRNPGRIDAAS